MNEANALRRVAKHTSIPAPRLIDFTQDSDRTGFMLMTKVTGYPAEKTYYLMTYEEREQLTRDLGKCISQYRRIKNHNESLICNTIGGPITDRRTDDIPYGPYMSKTAMLDDLTGGLEEIRKDKPLSMLYEKEHGICFTHADLHLSNIFLDGGRLSGIIDWENAGFKPEYWEYTAAMWPYMVMGQRFRFVAPRRRERLNWYCKPGEILLGESATDIVTLFARPVVPKSHGSRAKATDSWLENPYLIRQKLVTPQKRLRRQSDLGVATYTPSYVDDTQSHTLELPDEIHKTPSHSNDTRSRLLELPVEIHLLIFESLGLEDAFRLGTSCQYFWGVLKPLTARRFAGEFGIWAGTPVVCVSNRCEPGGDAAYPKGLLSADDVIELEQGLLKSELLEDIRPEKDGYDGPANLYSMAMYRYSRVTEQTFTEGFIPSLLRPAAESMQDIPCPPDVREVARLRPFDFYPTTREWVLRNLTTREFVRPTAVALREDLIHGPFIDILGYGEIILSKTCWSPGIYKGVWAGHALDIVPSTYLNDDGLWKDISRQVAGELMDIWGRGYGNDWKSRIIESNVQRASVNLASFRFES
ncbi:uncharacterized protein GIQ15_01356 [Arthroderma uncinatum]|uniref:uncharacterized protein n=1 Tax=Arthroderma uncinatum TaxID=74035 RepID=UPI00144AF337|nr:uncharacterized protein GIQ15_01356 [Arthroderma uncinatum]KAF3491839.1 hypothetical protein GIQ15_01356 [Arthroderma uncinatum]